MAVSSFLVIPITSHQITTLLLPSLLLLLSIIIHRVHFHHLSRIPGPFLAKLTPLWLYYHSYIGDECTTIHFLHAKYGPVLQVGPNDIDISDGDSINTIYVEKGGFLKSECYVNFDIDGHHSIFSALDPAHRAPRAKAVVTMFSTASLRSGNEVLYGCVNQFVARMKRESETGKAVNVLNLTRSLATDAVTAYLFHENYGGLDENDSQLSSSPFVDAFVAVGRFFYLPNRMFMFLEWAIGKFMLNKHTDASMTKVDEYVAKLVDKSEKSSNYPGRLMQAGFTKSETRAQCKDLIFAGTDSTGMNLATICWRLSQNPDM
jgi:hypothetical protein